MKRQDLLRCTRRQERTSSEKLYRSFCPVSYFCPKGGFFSAANATKRSRGSTDGDGASDKRSKLDNSQDDDPEESDRHDQNGEVVNSENDSDCRQTTQPFYSKQFSDEDSNGGSCEDEIINGVCVPKSAMQIRGQGYAGSDTVIVQPSHGSRVSAYHPFSRSQGMTNLHSHSHSRPPFYPEESHKRRKWSSHHMEAYPESGGTESDQGEGEEGDVDIGDRSTRDGSESSDHKNW